MLALLYLFLIFLFGDLIGRRFFLFRSVQHRLASAFLFGLLFGTWFTYLAALIFSSFSNPLLWANLSFFVVAGGACLWLRRSHRCPQPGDGILKRIFSSSPENISVKSEEIDLHPDRRAPGWGKWDWLCLAVCMIFGAWLMFATLDFSEGSFKFAIKAWSDFGANLSLSQSMALGNNFPVEHPFFPGETIKYHFLFWFQSANLSFLGLNLVWSVNLLSLISLAALLILIMTLAEVIFDTRVVGRIAAVLFFFGSTSLTYIPFLLSQNSVSEALNAILGSTNFLNSGYPYRGETWGGLTINVYAYQRHLITGAGMFLCVIVFLVDHYRRKNLLPSLERHPIENNDPGVVDLDKDESATLEYDDGNRSLETRPDRLAEREEIDKLPVQRGPEPEPRQSSDFRSEIYAMILTGIMIGALPYWNSAVFVAAVIVLVSLLILFPHRRYLAILIGTALAVGVPQVLVLRSGNLAQTGESLFQWGFIVANPTVPLVLEYLAWTFGIKLILILVALWFVSGAHRRLFLAFSSLVPVVFLLQLSTDPFNNHKLLNIWNILVAIYVAYALWIIGRKNLQRVVLACALAVVMIFSSIIDMFPLHNDAFVSVPYQNDRLTTWLTENTQSGDLFLTNTLLAHPILFTGRKVFLGNTLFAWSAGYDMVERDKAYRAMFRERDLAQLNVLLHENKIAYVAFDDGLRSNSMHPNLNESVYQENFEKVFEDTDHHYGNMTIYRVPITVTESGPGESQKPNFTNIDMSVPVVTAFEGGPGKGRGQFAGPRGIAVDAEGNFLVADTGNARIQKFSGDGKLLEILGKAGKGEGELYEPNGIAIDTIGNIYIADAGNHRLLRLKSDGTFVKQWDGPEPKFFGPRGVGIGPNNLVYVLDQGRSRVVRLDPETGTTTEWGKHGSGDSELLEPTGIEVSTDRVYVADALNDRIQIFSLSGDFIAAWPVPEWNAYPWQYPDMAFDPQNRHLYVTSPLSKEIIVFDMAGNRLESLRPDSPGDLENPSSLAIAATKTGKWLYVVNTGSSKIYKFELENGKEKAKASNGNSGRPNERQQAPVPKK